MIALLLKLGGWITDHPKSAFALVFLAGGLLGVLAGRRMCATPTIKEEATATTAAVAQATQDTKTQEGPWTRETWEYIDGARDDRNASDTGGVTVQGSPEGESASRRRAPNEPAEGPLVLHSIEKHEGSATETHSERESAQSTTQTLKLTQEGSSAPQWALSVGFENVLHDKALRLSVRRKFLGPIWVEGAFTPASRSVGVGAAIEF